MLEKIGQLPRSLIIIFWLQLLLVVWNAILTILSVILNSISENLFPVVNIVFSILVVLTIFQKSKFTRFLALALISASILVYGFATIGVLASGNPGGIVIIIQLAAYCITLWGLRTQKARAYFHI